MDYAHDHIAEMMHESEDLYDATLRLEIKLVPHDDYDGEPMDDQVEIEYITAMHHPACDTGDAFVHIN
jgi:hypothetical protein